MSLPYIFLFHCRYFPISSCPRLTAGNEWKPHQSYGKFNLWQVLLKQVFPLENIYSCPNDSHNWPPGECSKFLFSPEIYSMLENVYNLPVIFFLRPRTHLSSHGTFLEWHNSFWTGLPPLQKHGKDANVPNFGTQPGAFAVAFFAATFVLFVAQQLWKNCTTLGVPIRNNGTPNASRVLLWFWKCRQNRTILPVISGCSVEFDCFRLPHYVHESFIQQSLMCCSHLVLFLGKSLPCEFPCSSQNPRVLKLERLLDIEMRVRQGAENMIQMYSNGSVKVSL